MPWAEILEQLESHQKDYLRPIVESVIEAADHSLAGALWIEGLAVVPMPIRDPPLDVLITARTDNGDIRIRHAAVTGHNDDISRPMDQAVPLFWRFVNEKFGIS
jgi:hypothetical protein